MTESAFDEGGSAARDRLEEAREVLVRQLEEACRVTANGSAPETTGELRKLDDALLAASRTAEHLIAMRRDAQVKRGGAMLADTASVERIREFTDAGGTRWRAWAVTPGQATSSSPRNLGELQNGWLAFESLADGAKRRLADFPEDWMTMREEQLERLLQSAAAAPARKRSGEASSHD